jgi:hypothetical protein
MPLTDEELQKIVEDAQKEQEEAERHRGTHCSCCGKPHPVPFALPTECDKCAALGIE